ncbi:hypothetical protein KA005_09270, partial [bacterium]|nr:hypothetical protein [bacterium]
MKKVLWLAPYPYNYLRAGVDAHSHPAPWITELATELKDDVKLTIVNYSHRMKKDVDEFEEDGMRFAFIKSPRFRYDLFTIYRIRLNRLLKYLSKRKAEFDLIHVHGTEHQYECLAEKLGIPYIISIQGIINLYRPYHPNKLSPIYAR